jgi:hypothetical protein
MGSDPGQVHPPCAVLNEEKHVQAAQEHGVDVEEVDSEDRRHLTGQERPPGFARLVWARGRCPRP